MSKLHSAIDEWVKEHPYLDEIANLQKMIMTVLEELKLDEIALEDLIPNWSEIEKELEKGIPALKATTINDAAIELAVEGVGKVLEAFENAELPQQLSEQISKFKALIDEKPEFTSQVLKGVLAEENSYVDELENAQINHGVVMFLAWNILTHILEPLKLRVEESQKDIKWIKEYCPVCGQLPAMAQFVRTSKGRERDMVCGCCTTKWRYKRRGCPYCKNDDQKTLNIIELTDVLDLRIDTCDKCKGYVKTYTDEGNEEVVLADWSTLHMDIIAQNGGFKRIGYQLYEV